MSKIKRWPKHGRIIAEGWPNYRTLPLTVYQGGQGWQRISSMLQVRYRWRVGRVTVWRSEWRNYTEYTVMYVSPDGEWVQPANVQEKVGE